MAAELAGGENPPILDAVETVGPVDLRSHEVNVAVSVPVDGVGGDSLVLPVAVEGLKTVVADVGRGSLAGRADTEDAVGLDFLDETVNTADEFVDVVDAPFELRTDCGVFGLCGGIVVGIEFVGGGIGVEIVVEDDAVDVIFDHDILDYVAYALLYLLKGGVKDSFLAGLGDEPLGVGVFVVEVAAVLAVGVYAAIAVGIDPCIDLDSALVALIKEEAEGIEGGSGAAFGGNVLGPGLVGGFVGRVAVRAYVIVDNVDVGGLEIVQFGTQEASVSLGIVGHDRSGGPVAEIGCRIDGAMLAQVGGFCGGRSQGSHGDGGSQACCEKITCHLIDTIIVIDKCVWFKKSKGTRGCGPGLPSL